MGTSLYYAATREVPLSKDERAVIEALVADFAVEDQIRGYLATGEGANWESFRWRSIASTNEVFTGSVGLPDLSTQMFLDGVNHWGHLLGRVRAEVLSEAIWEARVEHAVLPWHEELGRYQVDQTW